MTFKNIYYIESNAQTTNKTKSFVIAESRVEAVDKFCTEFNFHSSQLTRVTCISDNDTILI